MAPTDLTACRHWIFDLDGTLTRPILDFPKIKRRLGLPLDRGILEVMNEMTPADRAQTARALEAIEHDMAGRAEASVGALSLLRRLQARGVTLGILTRNKKSFALHTLDVTGLARFFEPRYVLGRDEAAPKPSPEGIHFLLRDWGVTAADAVMVGDFLFDLQAADAAGVGRIYVDTTGAFPHAAWADLSVRSLTELLPRRTPDAEAPADTP